MPRIERALACFVLAAVAMIVGAGTVRAVGGPWPLPTSPRLVLPVQAPPKLAFTDINAANKAELESLPGIRAEQADAIIRGRPYAHPQDLVRRGIVAQALYERIKNRIIANGERP